MKKKDFDDFDGFMEFDFTDLLWLMLWLIPMGLVGLLISFLINSVI